jgi:hypothetical protein
VPQSNDAGDGQQAKAKRQQFHCGLRAKQNLAPVEMIRGKPAERQQQELRAELQSHYDSDRSRVPMCQLGENDPVLRGALHLRADIGHQRSNGPDPVVEVLQRTKCALQYEAFPLSGELPPLNLPNRRASARPGSSMPNPSATASSVARRLNTPTRQINR